MEVRGQLLCVKDSGWRCHEEVRSSTGIKTSEPEQRQIEVLHFFDEILGGYKSDRSAAGTSSFHVLWNER